MNAATAAYWRGAGGQMREVAGQAVDRRARSSAGTSIQPSRQPVIEKYLEKLFTTIASREVRQALASGSP